MDKIRSIFRNAICGLVAMGIIASGKARKARRKALSGDVVTSIYFHNPNKRLFARCIDWLAQRGYTFISAEQLIGILHHGHAIPKGAVWLSFDDGYQAWMEGVLPVVQERHVPVTLFIPSGIVENGGRLPWLHRDKAKATDARDAMSLRDLQMIAGYSEVTIGAHTVNHKVTADLPEDETRRELSESRRALESWTGAAVNCFAYPEGRFDGREKRVLSELGYQVAAATLCGFVTRKSDPFLLPRFCVSDNITFPEAICNMLGVWRPVVDPVIRLLGGERTTTAPALQAPMTEELRDRAQSADNRLKSTPDTPDFPVQSSRGQQI